MTGGMIQLANPVAEHYDTWIVGNAVHWQARAMVELEALIAPDVYAELKAEFDKHRPGMAFAQSQLFHDYVAPFAKRYVAQENSRTGQHVVIAGAGPTLRRSAKDYCPDADEVWGCNSAMTWLLDKGHRCTHGFTVDQTPHMVAEWASAPDVEYLLATTVHPNLTALLASKGHGITFFHNFVGVKKPPVSWPDTNGVMGSLPYEDWLYALLFPPTVRVGSGLNATTRAIDLAQYMGFSKITVLGADCCLQVKGRPRHDLPFGSAKHLNWLRKHTVMHADGGSALASSASPLTLGGEIDGRYWLTKADMIISAQWLAKMAMASEGRIELIGDTLPNALIGKSDEFFERLPNFVTADGQLANIPVLMQVG